MFHWAVGARISDAACNNPGLVPHVGAGPVRRARVPDKLLREVAAVPGGGGGLAGAALVTPKSLNPKPHASSPN